MRDRGSGDLVPVDERVAGHTFCGGSSYPAAARVS